MHAIRLGSAVLALLALMALLAGGCSSGRRGGGRGPVADGSVARDTGTVTDTDGGPDAGTGFDTGTDLPDTSVPPACGIVAEVTGTGAGIWTGTPAGTSALDGACHSGSGPEAVILWIPGAPGVYSINTNGSSIDTVLYIKAGSATPCGGAELSCDDDGGDDTQSLIELEVLEPLGIYEIVVDSYSSAGPVVLNIERLDTD